MNWGADATFTLSVRKMTLASYFRVPARRPNLKTAWRTTDHWFRSRAATFWCRPVSCCSMVDFTDASHPIEIAYFDRGPVDAERRTLGGMWSVYWHNGFIYGLETARGVDVFKLVPNKFITQNEIDAANQVHFDELNVQNQPKIVWPSNFVVARAYIDQLSRSHALTAKQLDALNGAIAKAESSKDVGQLKTMAASHDKDANSSKSPSDASRMRAISGLFKERAGSAR